MDQLKDLSATQAVLLAASLASESNIAALRALLLARPNQFDAPLTYRLILSFLPETTDPEQYSSLLADALDRSSNHDLDADTLAAAGQVDVSPVKLLAQEEARESLRKLPLRPLVSDGGSDAAASLLSAAPNDPLVHFLISRAYAIDRETGLISLVPRLFRPFLSRSVFLRTWYASNVLPILRLDGEYYGQDDEATLGLDTLADLDDPSTIATLMSKSIATAREGHASPESVGRDLRGLVGPWTFGSSQRKRRRLGYQQLPLDGEETLRKQAQRVRSNTLQCKIGKCGKTFEDETAWRLHVESAHDRFYTNLKQDVLQPHNALAMNFDSDVVGFDSDADQASTWQDLFQWLIGTAAEDFSFTICAVNGWRGPSDVDLGDADAEGDAPFGLSNETSDALHLQYCQAIFAAVYASQSDSADAIQGAHAALAVLADLLEFIPPPDLITSVDLLPRIQRLTTPLELLPKLLLQPESLMLPDQPLTKPTLESYSLLQMFTYSAYQLQSLGHPLSVAQVCKISFSSDATDVLHLLQTMLTALISAKHDSERWSYTRSILLFLWNWALPHSPDGSKDGYGVFGRIEHDTFEREILKAILAAGHFGLVKDVYLRPELEHRPLALADVEATITSLAHEFFDAASNGNRTRGSMKRASDLIAAFQKDFPDSPAIRKCQALIAAAHALSFYSLTFEGGVPTRPVRIRETDDPISLIRAVLSQNARSYAKLDDLIDIGRNLSTALPPSSKVSFMDFAAIDADVNADAQSRLDIAARRVTGAAIEAALAEDDFETAYSYVVNRLGAAPAALDDVSWRAALAAGKQPLPPLPSPSKQTRRLEQRLELLARALALAPGPALPEILAAWRRCEEELLTQLAAADAAERSADDAAALAVRTRAPLPGGFGDELLEPALSVQPRRRELGRGGGEEAPMGLFEVARGAARALGRSVGDAKRAPPQPAPARAPHLPAKAVGNDNASGGDDAEQDDAWGDWGDNEDGDDDGAGGRVRKRDIVANSFVRGVGWMLGATPVGEAGGEQQQQQQSQRDAR